MRKTSAASSASRKTPTRNQVVAAFAVLTHSYRCGGGQQDHPAAPDQAADSPFRLGARPHIGAKPINLLLETKREAEARQSRFHVQMGTECVVYRVFDIAGVLSVLGAPSREEALGP